jgi:ABC-2 type transport system permease protein
VSLYTAETRRLVKRRFTKLFVTGALVVLAAVAVGMFFTNQKVDAGRVAQAQAQAQADFDSAVQQAAQERKDCAAAKGTPKESQFPANCDEMYAPQQSDFNPEWYMPSTFDFKRSFPAMVTTMAALLALAAFVIGASFVGAEWNSGGMMNLLLWRPQRLRVLGTKLAAFLVALAALTVVVSVVWTGVFRLIAQVRGSTEGITAGVWQSIGLMELRALGLVLVVGALGFALASLGRHTAMALGAAIGAIVVLQFGLGSVLFMAQVKFAEAYLVPVWVTAWMEKSVVIEDDNSCDFSSFAGCQADSITITWPMAGGAMAALFVLFVGAAMWTMRSRDIT